MPPFLVTLTQITRAFLSCIFLYTGEPSSLCLLFVTLYSIRRCFQYRNEIVDKNSSADEIANVNVFTTTSHMYFTIPKKKLLGLTN